VSEKFICLCCGDRPALDGSTACRECWRGLERDLAQMPALIEQLDVTITRQDRVTIGSGSGQRGTPDDGADADVVLPATLRWMRADQAIGTHEQGDAFNVGASRARDQLHSTLVGWIRVALEEHPAYAAFPVAGPARQGEPWPVVYQERTINVSSTRAIAVQVFALFGWMQGHPAGNEAIVAIRRSVNQARRAIDRALEVEYAGTCSAITSGCPGPGSCQCGCHDGYQAACTLPGGCGLGHGAPCPEELYLPTSRSTATVRCRTCGTEHDVAARRRYLLEVSRDYLVTTTEACRAVSVYGEGSITDATIRKWKQRGRLIARGHDAEGRDLWRLGDVTDLATGRDTRKGD
jgi:hypothetical protein